MRPYISIFANMSHIAGIETVLDEPPARSFSIRNMAGFPYHTILSTAWKSNHIADTKEVIAEIIDNRLNRVFVGVNMQDVFISSDLCYQMSASPVPLMLGGV